LSTNLVFDRYFVTAMKIHAVCTDIGLTKDIAKLYVYIYVKATESPDGFEYFDGDCTVEIQALNALLRRGLNDAVICDGELTSETFLEIFKSYVSKKMTAVECNLQKEYGLENVLRGELANRLRLHIDENYRKEHIETFKTKVLTEIHTYDDAKVKMSNLNYQIKLAKQQHEFENLID
jgi:hypothetical protein